VSFLRVFGLAEQKVCIWCGLKNGQGLRPCRFSPAPNLGQQGTSAFLFKKRVKGLCPLGQGSTTLGSRDCVPCFFDIIARF